MLKKLISRLFNYNDKIIRQYQIDVDKINKISEHLKSLSDDELRAKVDKYIDSSLENKHKHKTFAFVREVSRRLLGLYHYDVQLIGGLILLDNKIAEMKTGEGKTLVALLPAIHNVLLGRQVHIVTTNDYLSKRDMELLKPVYNYFSVTVAYNPTVGNQPIDYQAKKDIYYSDVVYTTHNELCFDYLRNNNVTFKDDKFMMEFIHDNESNPYGSGCLDYVIIDEVDSILIDEARNPLILSTPSNIPLENYSIARDIVKNVLKRSTFDREVFLNTYMDIQKMQNITQLEKERLDEIAKNRESNQEADGDFFLENSTQTLNLFEEAYIKIEQYLMELGLIKHPTDLYYNGLYLSLIHNAIFAEYLYLKDRDYIVKDGKVIIIDQSTGRLLESSRWRDGVHQAIECKEGVEINPENRARSQITYQNFFNLYKDKAGMTGTAWTEASELMSTYKLETIVVPTNKPICRHDYPDKMFLSKEIKYQELLKLIIDKHNKGQPILIGTPALYISEEVAELLRLAKLSFNILNAKNNEREAEIIADAGKVGAITISTNMAGRGTDIILGGKNSTQEEHDKVVELGGLAVIGVDKNQSRRIDNQLRGRSGRQGEVGDSVFFVSLEDELIQDYTKIELINYAKRFFENIESMKQNELAGGWNKPIETAQRNAENLNYNARLQSFKVDNILSSQRNAYYQQRNEILFSDNQEIEALLLRFIHSYLKSEYQLQGNSPSTLDIDIDYDLLDNILRQCDDFTEDFGITKNKTNVLINEAMDKVVNNESITLDEALNILSQCILDMYKLRWKRIEVVEGQDSIYSFIRLTLLQSLDELWSKHLEDVEIIKKNSRLSHYAQKDPFMEFQKRNHDNFLLLFKDWETQSVYNLISEQLNPEVRDIADFEFSDDIKNMTPEEVKRELDTLTKQLMQNELQKIYDKIEEVKD